jgi:preprotein translocase subunit SecF
MGGIRFINATSFLAFMSRRERRLQRRNILKKKPSYSHDSYEHHAQPEQGVHHEHHHSEEHVHHERQEEPSRNFYEKNYKQLMLIPIIMLLASFVLIGVQLAQTGSVMQFGVSVTGGISVTIPDVDEFVPTDVQNVLLAQFPGSDVSVRRLVSGGSISANVEASNINNEVLLQALRETFGEFDVYSLEETGSTLGQSFFRQSIIALIFAFVLMGLVVFISFKTFIPSLAVILSAVFDISVTIAIVNLFGMRISTAGLAAFLMLIGYSVDTDILLTSKIIKQKRGTVMARIYDAMGTGMMMSLTTIAALIVGIIFSNSEVLTQIMTIVLIGLVVDLVSTWIQNAGILRLYMDGKDE